MAGWDGSNPISDYTVPQPGLYAHAFNSSLTHTGVSLQIHLSVSPYIFFVESWSSSSILKLKDCFLPLDSSLPYCFHRFLNSGTHLTLELSPRSSSSILELGDSPPSWSLSTRLTDFRSPGLTKFLSSTLSSSQLRPPPDDPSWNFQCVMLAVI